MYDIALPISNISCEDNYNECEQEVMKKLASIGYPVDFWPSDSVSKGFVSYWKSTGLPRNPAPVNLAIEKNEYSWKPMPAAVVKLFNNSFKHVTHAFFCITKGEDWWPYDKAFLCNDANSYMLFMLYTAALLDQSVLEMPGKAQNKKKVGRPRNEAVHAAKAEKSYRYKLWLAQCAEYRAELKVAEDRYKQARDEAEKLRLELKVIKNKGAPRFS